MSTTIDLESLCGLYINIASAGHGRMRASLHDYASDRVIFSAIEATADDACVELAREVLTIYLRLWHHIENELEMPQRFHSTRKEGVWSITASPWAVYPELRPTASRRLALEAAGKFLPEQLEHIGTELLRFARSDREAQAANRSPGEEMSVRLVDKLFPDHRLDVSTRPALDDETSKAMIGPVELDCDEAREIYGYTTEQLNAFWADVEAAHAAHLKRRN